MTETVIRVSDEAKNRLWETLDRMSDKLEVIEKQLSEVVRLEERVNYHDVSLTRHGASLDKISDRTRRLEMWQAHHGESTYDDSMFDIMRSGIKINSKKIMHIEGNEAENKGQKDVAKEILKWVSVMLAGIVVYYMTKGIK
jgi:hypothetical protein